MMIIIIERWRLSKSLFSTSLSISQHLFEEKVAKSFIPEAFEPLVTPSAQLLLPHCRSSQSAEKVRSLMSMA
jgi:hypothetical protein